MRKVTALSSRFFFRRAVNGEKFLGIMNGKSFLNSFHFPSLGFVMDFSALGRLKMWRNRRFIFHAFNQLHKPRLGDKTAFICFRSKVDLGRILEKERRKNRNVRLIDVKHRPPHKKHRIVKCHRYKKRLRSH